MDTPKKRRNSTKNPLAKRYRRIYLNTSSPLAHIYLPESPKAHVIRDLLINHDISLIALFLPEWVTARMHDLEQDRAFQAHHLNHFTFWLSDGMNDREKQLAVRVQKIGVDPIRKTVSPYDLLFGESTGLPVRTEYLSNPREFYGMEKIEHDEFRIWKKNKVTLVDGAEKRNIPLEIVRMILEMVLESRSKTDLLPTILICRLVNKTWHHLATTAACRRLTLSEGQFRTFFEGPKGNLYPYLACLDLWSRNPKFGTQVVHSHPNNPLAYEHELVDLLTLSPILGTVRLMDTRGSDYREFARVVGWRSDPESQQDRLAPDLVHVLNASTIKIHRLISESDPNNIWELNESLKEVWEKEIPFRFFCLSDPSRELLQVIGRALQALSQAFGENTQANKCDFRLTFEGAGQWPHVDAVEWFGREREWLATIWPRNVSLAVISLDQRGRSHWVEWNVGSPLLKWEIQKPFKSKMYRIVSHTWEILHSDV
ncbi:hypothetical protein BC937DRAFT_93191 [Endogone sp. FLAS-F59071]|nr:hypothetical protein BC937DRAFT_93191 [Endogone sp. FLAS-F59071]|eukprot:RUS14887.1 hypothetical protein BC937DRAFT_93191 [Endogone sp. FLAS-F59071]